MTNLRVLSPADGEWSEWLDLVPHDCYHTAAYHQVAQACGEGQPHLAVFGTRDRFVAWPYTVRPVSDVHGLAHLAFADVASVYGYPGPLVHNCGREPSFLAAAWLAFVSTWREQLGVTVFTRFHPLLENHAWLQTFSPMNAVPGAVEPGTGTRAIGHTVSIDLTQADEEAVGGYQKVLRQEIAAGRRAGLTTTEDTDWRHVCEFLELYRQTMTRNRAASHYFFDREYVDRLRRALPAHVRLLLTRLGARIAAAGIFIEYRGIVQAHLAGSCDELRALSPLKVLLDDVRRWAHSRGNTVLHLGGGRAGKDDSLLAFKGRFSKRRHEFHVGRWVLDPVAYRLLCNHAGIDTEGAAGTPGGEEFFPPYRSPSCHTSTLGAPPPQANVRS